MAETVTTARPSVAKPVSRLRSRTAETGSASALARHLDCSRTYIGKLEAEGEIQRKVTASHSIGAALPACDTCGASGGNHRVVQCLFEYNKPSRRPVSLF